VRAPSGKTNPVSVLTVVGLVIAGWWGFHHLPLYFDNLEAQEAAAQAINIAVTETPEAAKANILRRLNFMHGGNDPAGWHFQVDEETGVESVVKGLGVLDDNVNVDVDTDEKKVTVRVEYDRVIELTPLKQRRTIHFSITKTGKTR
jgi:hypothetical protein